MSGVTAQEVVEKVNEGSAVFETRYYGFALVQLAPMDGGKFRPHLWALYVNSEHRGKKLGHLFMRQLLRKFATDYHMTLGCNGAKRRAFFGRLGFRIENREGDYRRMTTNDYR
jgi:GNAT superfamily N-acetyltransferase